MILYNVHIYREMRLLFLDIQAESPEQAAETCKEFPAEEARGEALDCDGETFTALVDTQGDHDYSQSVTFDFQPERIRKAAPELLTALENLMVRIGDLACEFSICEEIAEGEAGKAAEIAILRARAAGVESRPTEIRELLAARRQIAAIWGIDDVQWIRPNLTDDQAWEVLQTAEHGHQADIGINWDVLGCHADLIFGDDAQSDEAEGK